MKWGEGGGVEGSGCLVGRRLRCSTPLCSARSTSTYCGRRPRLCAPVIQGKWVVMTVALFFTTETGTDCKKVYQIGRRVTVARRG